MNRHEVTAIAVRLFAIAIFIYLIKEMMPAIFMYIARTGTPSITTFGLIGILTFLLILVPVLWFFPYTIASIILPKEKLNTKEYKWNNENFLSCGLIILGIYFLYYVISDAIMWLYISNYSGTSNNSYMLRPLTIDDKASIAATVVEFLLSMFLIFGSTGIARLVIKIRGRSDF